MPLCFATRWSYVAVVLVNSSPRFQQKCALHFQVMWLHPSIFSMGALHLGAANRTGLRGRLKRTKLQHAYLTMAVVTNVMWGSGSTLLVELSMCWRIHALTVVFT